MFFIDRLLRIHHMEQNENNNDIAMCASQTIECGLDGGNDVERRCGR